MPFIRRNLLAGLAFALLSILIARPVLATDYYADVSGGPWTSSSTWHLVSNSGPAAPAGTYPGSAAGDRAIIDFQGITITLNAVVPNAVTLDANNVSCFVNVNAGANLPLIGASQIAGGTILNLTGGTIDNDGTLAIGINSGFNWSGGTLTGSGSTTLAADPTIPALLTLSGGTLDTHTLNINGKATWTAGTWTLTSGQVNISSSGIFDIQSLGAILGTGQITNAGKVEKTAGAGGTNIVPPLNNNNLVKVAIGALVMNGTHTFGTFDIGIGAQLELAGTIAPGTSTSQGGGELKIVGALTIDTFAAFNINHLRMSGGALNGPGTANISGTTTFDGGTWSGVRVNLLPGSTTNITGVAAATLTTSSRVDNSGTFNVTAGAGLLAIHDGAYIRNLTTLNLVGDVTIDSNSVINARINNESGASILKTAGAGTAIIKVILNNDGLVQSNSGSIQFTKSGTHTGTFKICDACTFDFAAGDHTLDGALIQYINFNGGAIAKLSGATFDIPTSAQISTNHQFIQTAGTVTGDGSLAIFAAFIWSGGTHSGTGDTQLASYSHVFNGANSQMMIFGRDMLINGTVTYSPAGTNYLSINGGAVLANGSGYTIDLTTDAPINSDGTGVIDNNGGTVVKSGGTGMAVIHPIFNSYNPIILADSRVRTNSLVVVPSGATLNVMSGQVALAGGGYNNGNLFVPNATNAVIFTFNTYDLNAGTNTNAADLGLFRVDGGTLNLNTALTLTNVELLWGTITGFDLTIANKMKWTGGTLLGPGNTTIDAPATLSHLLPTLPSFLNGRTLENKGIVEYEGTGLQLTNNAVISNNLNAEFRARDGALLNGAGTNTFNNGGTLKKIGTSSGMRFDMPVKNSGTISSEVNGQAMIFAGGGSMDPGATMTTSPGALIDFFGGTFIVNGGSMTGTGQLRVNGGTLQVDANVSTTNAFVLSSGTLTGSGTFTVNGGQWTGGTMTGTGSIVNGSPAVFDIAAPPTTQLQRDFLNQGTLNVTTDLTFIGTATLTNSGTMNLGANLDIFCSSCSGRIHNTGSATSVSGSSHINVRFDNDGSAVTSASSTMALKAGGTHTGDFTGAGDRQFGGTHTFGATSDVSGGSVLWLPGTFTLNGTFAITSFSFHDPGSTVLFNTTSAATTETLIVNGDVGGTAALVVNGTGLSQWRGGTISGASPFTIGPNASLSISSFGLPIILDGRVLTINGSATLGADLTLTNGASIVNNNVVGMNSTTGVNSGAGSNTFVNDGTFSQMGPGTPPFGPAFTNNATVRLFAGSVDFTGGYTQNAGSTDLDGGGMSSPLQITFNGGLLKGVGTITGSVANNGATVAPGASPGLITVLGNYSQGTSGVLDIELGGTTAGSQYDRLAVSGSATLAGTVNVTLINSFILSSGDVFDVVTYASRSGVFSPENLPPFPGGTFTSTYTPAAYQLVASSLTPPAADVGVTKSGPASASEGDLINYTIVVTNLGGSSVANVIVNDPTPAGLVFFINSGACTTPFPCALGTLAAGETRTITATYRVGPAGGSTITNTATINTADTNATNNTSSVVTSIACPSVAATNLKPSGSGPMSGTLTWSDTKAELYHVFFGPKGSGCTTLLGTTTTSSMPYDGLLGDAEYEWKVVSSYDGCPAQSSSCVTFVTDDCPLAEAPLASVVGQATSTKTYAVTWEEVPGAIRYEVEEATSPAFTDAVTTVVNAGLSAEFHHEASEATGYWYRVRAFTACNDQPGPYSIIIRVVIVPPPPASDKNPNITIPVGSTDLIVQKVFIPGTPGLTQFYTATADRPWLFVTPPSGALPPSGVTLDVVIDPAELPNGTFIATIIVNIDVAASILRTNGTTVSIPISVNLVTPVTPVSSKGAASQYAVIIPAVGHLSGINSEWQSDVRITNAGFRPYKYRLTFTPAAGIAAGGVKQTNVNVDAGATIALDDIVRTWYGFGSLKDGESGMLEILPVDDPVNASLVTVASSRTYNVTQNGTLGQFVPAIPFPSFIGKAAAGGIGQILSLQQIAQTNAFRTNVGITEASGKSANTVISIFNAAGVKLTDIPQLVAAGQQLQLNALLLQKGITLDDGRIEIRVTDGDGKITGYASVVDNGTGDPLLVSGVPLGQAGATRYVLPGAANINTGFADWRTDMRIFNYGTIPQTATLTFFPLGTGSPRTAQVEAKVGEVVALNNVVKTLFNGENLGGVVHVTTPQPASFIVSGRTYNQTDAGTFGQFIPAVTVEQGIARGGKTLHILQIEDSSRFRTNIAVVEMTGKPAVVELQVVLPDSKFTPTITVPLAANEFRQFNIVRDLNLGNVYNARVAIRVIEGEGRVTAAGSLIDEFTGDPTLIPGQQ